MTPSKPEPAHDPCWTVPFAAVTAAGCAVFGVGQLAGIALGDSDTAWRLVYGPVALAVAARAYLALRIALRDLAARKG